MGFNSIIQALERLTEEELREVNGCVVDILKERRNSKVASIKRSMRVGTKVKLKDSACKGKGDRLYQKTGTITKLNPKKAVVSFDVGTWTIPYSLLETE